jgi:hypothetical protein
MLRQGENVTAVFAAARSAILRASVVRSPGSQHVTVVSDQPSGEGYSWGRNEVSRRIS